MSAVGEVWMGGEEGERLKIIFNFPFEWRYTARCFYSTGDMWLYDVRECCRCGCLGWCRGFESQREKKSRGRTGKEIVLLYIFKNMDYETQKIDRNQDWKIDEVRVVVKNAWVEIGKAICEISRDDETVREARGVDVHEEFQNQWIWLELRRLQEETIVSLGATQITMSVNKNNDGSYRFHTQKSWFELWYSDDRLHYLKKDL